MNNPKIAMVSIDDIIPYENNPRKNDEAVDKVANSIKEFGFQSPIIIDGNNIIICGHTRAKAAKQLGLTEVPVIVADDLTPDQVKAYRLADNKTGELAIWDFPKLNLELEDIDWLDINMEDFGFGINSYFEDSVIKEPENTSKELDLEELSDDKFECECPRCGFRFNHG